MEPNLTTQKTRRLSLFLQFPNKGRTFATLSHFSCPYFKLVRLLCHHRLPLFSQSRKGQLQQQMESLSAGCGGLQSNSWVLLFLLRDRQTARSLFRDKSSSVSSTLSFKYLAILTSDLPFSELLTDFFLGLNPF